MSESALPLDDLLVVEIGESIASAYAGKLLADFGAKVIRIDELSGGDLYRSHPLVGQGRDGLPVGAAYLYLNQNKQSVALNLEHERGQDVLAQLLARADVLIDGLGFDELARLGFEHKQILEKHPGLFIAAITPFGLSGPYRDLHPSDLAVLALGGLLNMVGFPDREPLRLGGSQAQYAAGLSAFTAVLAGITYRDRGGNGQIADVSMLETVAFMEWKSGSYYEADGKVRYRVGDLAQWQVLPASDGYVGLVYQDPTWPSVKELVGAPELNDERFATRAGRVEHAEEIRAILIPWFIARSKHDIYREGQSRGIPLGFVATMQDLLESEQYSARGFWNQVNHPVHEPSLYPGEPYKITGIEPRQGRAPLPGEHTFDVLAAQLDLSREDIQALRLEGVL